MATLGRIDEFNAETGVWEEYAERLERFFHANDIDNPEKKRSILLSVCGAATAVPYKSIVECLQRHYNPTPSEIVQLHCNFGEQLEQMLHNRIVWGVADPLLQCQLLAELNLTFKIEEERALATEMANRNAQKSRHFCTMGNTHCPCHKRGWKFKYLW
uniref:Uncharacterized protein n=1 Tax=Erpetoichthys calabaricus TaxID=27687 RepID=A0A8C4X4X8_ERPCA